MSLYEHDRLSRIFLAAADLDNPLLRRRLLDVECGDDHHLRNRIERLLHQDASTSPLDEPLQVTLAEQVVCSAHAESPHQRRLGNCRILGRLGRGGMATVYRAAQDNPAREVALKVIDLHADCPEQRHRFEREARALARLSHPGIALIYGAGIDDATEEPTAYIVMELVEGDRLDHHVHRHAHPPRRIAELTAALCDAVHHAHQRGVIHRDLKPANILVTALGQCKVLDFGVARLLAADEPFTIPGVIVGTPMYMSPEQIAGDTDRIDIRTDVYAIGVILRQLLGDKSPAARVVPPELSLIASKASSPSPEDRYESAAALAADLRRWLKHEPIAARPPSAGYVLAKWSRRNPGMLASLTCAILATLGGLAAFAWQASVANAAWEHARHEARSAESMLTFIERTFSAEEARTKGPNARLSDLLDHAASMNVQENAADPDTLGRLASLFGRAYMNMGMKHKARAQLDLATRSFSDDRSEHAMTARIFLSNVLRKSAQAEKAAGLAEEVYQDRLLVNGPDSAATLFALRSFGLASSDTRQQEHAEACLSQAAAGFERVLGRAHEQTLHTRADLAQVMIREGRLRKGITILEPDYELARRDLKPDHPTTMNIALKLANALNEVGKPREAMVICDRHLRTLESAMGPAHPLTVGMTTQWAQANLKLGRASVAIDGVKEALRASEAAGDPVEVRAGLRRLLVQLNRASIQRNRSSKAVVDATVP